MNLAFDLDITGKADVKPTNNVVSDLVLKGKIDFISNPILNSQEKIVHETAKSKAKKFKEAHIELLDAVTKVAETRLYEKFKITSTYAYCVKVLNISDDITCTLTKLIRVSKKVPELKEAINKGLHMTNARMVATIVTPENKTEWLEKAKTLSQRKLQKEIAKSFPQEAVQEKVKYVADKRLKLELGLEEETVDLLRWAQDFISQKSRSAANFEATLKKVLKEFKEKNDPVQRAERAEDRKNKKDSKTNALNHKSKIQAKSQDPKTLLDQEMTVTNPLHVAQRVDNSRKRRQSQKQETSIKFEKPLTSLKFERTNISAKVIHQVDLRDYRKCRELLPNGEICGSTRWLDYHHIIEVQHGGTNTLENLITLCGFHHRLRHK